MGSKIITFHILLSPSLIFTLITASISSDPHSAVGTFRSHVVPWGGRRSVLSEDIPAARWQWSQRDANNNRLGAEMPIRSIIRDDTFPGVVINRSGTFKVSYTAKGVTLTLVPRLKGCQNNTPTGTHPKWCLTPVSETDISPDRVSKLTPI